jgi:hypothetical protein
MGLEESRSAELSEARAVTLVGEDMPATGQDLRTIALEPAPLAGADMTMVYQIAGVSSKDEHRAAIERDIDEPRKMTYGTVNIPDEILDVLEHSRFIAAARSIGFEPIITSGLAAGLYGSPRLISVDIDFTMARSSGMETDLKNLLDTVTGESTELIQLPKGFAPCLGIFTKIASPGSGGQATKGTAVDLDGLAICRFRPAPRGFVYEFSVDSHDLLCCRTVRLPSGDSVKLIPPEHVVFYKLLAARGHDVGKYDLMDAGAIIATSRLDPQMILKLVTRQSFQTARGFEKLDGAHLLALYDSYGNVGPATDALLIEAGLDRPEVRRSVLSWLEQADERTQLAQISPDGARELVVTTIKQAALVSRLLESLDRTAASFREYAPRSGSGMTVCLADVDKENGFVAGSALIRETLKLCSPPALFQQVAAQNRLL